MEYPEVRVPIDDFKADFETYFEMVEKGMVIILTENGEDVLVCVPAELYEELSRNKLT